MTGRQSLALGVLLLTGCGGATAPTGPDGPGDEGPAVIKSVALSPRGFPTDFSHLDEFFQEASSLPDAGVTWNGSWRDDLENGTDAGSPPGGALLVAEQADVYGFEPVVVFGWRSDEELHVRVPGNAVNDWSNEEAAALFVQMARTYASERHPPVVFLGNESDLYFDLNPEDYLRWVDVYDRAYEAVKEVSPETEVGPVFQYERLAGIGVLANMDTPLWGALDAHDLSHVDLIGLTVYPFFAYSTPQQIPADYFAPLDTHRGSVPIAITESGWPAEPGENGPPPWDTSEESQVAYVDALRRMLAGRGARVVTWLYIHPLQPTATPAGPAWNIFHSISLRREDGAERDVYAEWRDFEPPAP